MRRHVVTRTIEADPDAVWTLLGDLTNISWMPPTSRVECDGSGPGMRRNIYGSSDTPVTEELISHDDSRRSFVYRIVANNPLPADPYTVTADVDAGPSGSSIVTWSVEFESATPQVVIDGIDAVYPMIAGWLEDAAKAS